METKPDSMVDVESQERKAVSEKMRTSFPKSLRHAVGLATMERKLCEELGDNEGEERSGKHRKKEKTDDGAAERLTQLILRKEVTKLSPQAFLCMLLEALDPPPPVLFEDLTFALVEIFVGKNLLPGYSSASLVGGCLSFAAAALRFEIPYTWDNFDKDGLKINWHGERCAYNVLWLERGRLAKLVAEQGGSVSALSLPVNQKGRVAEWMLRLDEKRRKEYRKQEQAAKARERRDVP